jgi:uncharacterized protein involved in exopolysaccharide biosynthesis
VRSDNCKLASPRLFSEIVDVRSVMTNPLRRSAVPQEVFLIAEESAPLVRFTVALLRERRLIARVTLAAALAAVGLTMATPRSYSATASFFPQARRTGSNLAGVAAQFGLSLPTDQGAQSPAFYADLLTSREILERIVDARYTFLAKDGHAASGTLVEVFDRTESDSLQRRDEAARILARSVSATANQKTGVVKLSVRAASPALAATIAQRFLTELDRFNLQSRQSQAAAERRFTERSLQDARESLRRAEQEMESYLSRNAIVGSPLQQLVRDRLRREVEMRQQLQNSLAQSYEQAKIDEVRDTPVFTVIESPRPPVRPDSRGGLLKVATGIVISGVLGILIVLTRMSNADVGMSSESEQLSREWRSTLADIRRPWRLLWGSRST